DATKRATLNPSANLVDGATYTATVKGGAGGAKDLAGNPLAADKVWSFTTAAAGDTTAPETTIDAGPSGTVTTRSATFEFSSSEASSIYECRLDSGTWSGCSSPKGYTDLVDGSHTFEVRATDVAGNTDATPASRTWTVEATAPTVTSVSPAGGATGVAVGADVTATFSEAMDASTINGTTVMLVKQSGTSAVAAVVTYDSTNTSAILNPNADLEAGTTYTTTVKGGPSGAKDVAGNPLATDKVWSFTTAAAGDTTAPTVTGVTPTDGATGVAVTVDAEATFSEAMDATTITGTTVTLVRQGAETAVAAAVTYDSTTRQAILNPNANLEAGATYTATVKGGASGVKDTAGNALASDKVWSFTTQVADITAPTVNSVAPANGATGVAVAANAQAVFSEAMDAATITDSSFTLVKQGTTTPVAASVSYDSASDTTTLNPGTDLEAGVAYTATVKGGASGVKDVAGNALTSDKVWSFTTAAAGDTTAPTVTEVSPAAGETGVAVGVDATATFSETVDATTLTTSTFTLVRQGTTTAVAAAVSYDSTNKRAILNPNVNLQDGASYTATVKGGANGVKDVAGNALASDKVWSFTVEPLAAPTNQTATRSGTGDKQRIDLKWVDNSSIEAKYVIERATNADFTSNLLTREVGANSTSYRDTSLARTTAYYYRVFAMKSDGTRSSASNTASVLTK
ncbi:MAG: hypothetical protein AVDCRST_MAG93-3475, partial [uncultured Chloroflexia bacterium]